MDDILRINLFTNKLEEISFGIGRNIYRISNIGNINSKKIIYGFQNEIYLLIGCINISDFNLFDENNENKLISYLEYFKDILNINWTENLMANLEVVIYFSHFDIFIEKLKEIDLKICFPDYDGKKIYFYILFLFLIYFFIDHHN